MIPRELDVLIIERDTAIAGALAASFQKRGHYVRVASSCEEALDLPRPDALIACADPGGLTATELISHYRSTGALPRCVVIADRPSLDGCREALRLGAADYLPTPFRLEDVIRAVESDAPAANTSGCPSLQLEIDADQASMLRAGRELAAFCTRAGLGPSTRARLVSATLECVENAVLHAYQPGEAGTIEIEAVLDARECLVRVVDQGVGLIADESAQEHEDGLRPGLERAAGCAEELRVLSAPGAGTTAELRFRAYRVDFDEAGTIDLSEYDYFTPETAREVLRTLAVEECSELFTLSPSLALLVGRLLAGPQTGAGLASTLKS
ncbi:MAG: ATP-binding protein [Planctomycetes bacterium]|nr:ATP-binding protein [Planctomycetota bacterium]MCB9905042.1 ATP-binding protein [Planctomycetota bacterium]